MKTAASHASNAGTWAMSASGVVSSSSTGG
jgi:hypothetical protein